MSHAVENPWHYNTHDVFMWTELVTGTWDPQVEQGMMADAPTRNKTSDPQCVCVYYLFLHQPKVKKKDWSAMSVNFK